MKFIALMLVSFLPIHPTGTPLTTTPRPVYLNHSTPPSIKKHSLDNEQYILEIEEGSVFDAENIITQDGYLIKDFWVLSHAHTNLDMVDWESLTRTYYNERIAVVCCGSSSSYYHWLLQVLTRIFLLQKSHIPFDKIYVECEQYPWQLSSLKTVLHHLRIDESRVIVAPKNRYTLMRARTLIVPSLPLTCSNSFLDAYADCYTTPSCAQWVVPFLQKVFLQEPVTTKESYKKIYISRRSSTTRFVLNEEEIVRELVKRGFSILYLEYLPTTKQAEIFKQARLIVGPHGAGFTNIVFSEPGYILVDIEHLFTDVSPRSFFRDLALFTSGIHIPYYVDRVTKDYRDAAFNVPLEPFLKFIDMLCTVTGT